jgi:hypothetical protein
VTPRSGDPSPPAEDPAAAHDLPIGESDAAKIFRRARWTLAFAISATALGLMAYWLATGTRPACQVVTVAPVSAQHTTTTTTTTCSLPSVSDFVYVLAVVGLLLLPDAKSLSFGGLGFERLTYQVEQQTHEIGQLRQQVSTTINIGADRSLLDDLRSGVRDLNGRLSQSRSALPTDALTEDMVREFDDIAQRIDSASATELVNAAFTGRRRLHGAGYPPARRGPRRRLRVRAAQVGGRQAGSDDSRGSHPGHSMAPGVFRRAG